MWVRERLGTERVSERRACRVLGQVRSTQRRERQIPDDEARLVAEMVELATQYGRYGYRRITAMLQGKGGKVNHKRVERLWRQEGLKVPSKQPKRRRLWLNDGSCVRLRAAHKDHVWSCDFVPERTHDGRAFRLLTLLDEYTRECLSLSGPITDRSLQLRRSGNGSRPLGSGPCTSSRAAPGRMGTLRASMGSFGMSC